MSKSIPTEKEVNQMVDGITTKLKPVGSCMKMSISITVYILMFLVPTALEAFPIIYYHDYAVTKTVLIVNCSILMILTSIIGALAVIHFHHTDDYENDYNRRYHHQSGCNNCDYALCEHPSDPYSLIRGGYLSLVLIPWGLCNIISVWVNANKLIGDSAVWVIVMALLPGLLYAIGTGCGFGIQKSIIEHDDQNNQKN